MNLRHDIPWRFIAYAVAVAAFVWSVSHRRDLHLVLGLGPEVRAVIGEQTRASSVLLTFNPDDPTERETRLVEIGGTFRADCEHGWYSSTTIRVRFQSRLDGSGRPLAPLSRADCERLAENMRVNSQRTSHDASFPPISLGPDGPDSCRFRLR